MPRFWIGVASREHVRIGTAGGFAQLCHGKAQPLRRMAVGDGLIYYSSKVVMGGDAACQAFTALGRVAGDAVYPFEMAPGFAPFRRDIEFLPAQDAPIRPLLAQLDFIRDKTRWGYAFRFGHLEIGAEDFARIARAMDFSGTVPGWPSPVPAHR